MQLGSPWRLGTIYSTNMKSAYNAGCEEFFQKNKANRPYGQFVAVMNAETRKIVGAGKTQEVRIYADRKTHVRKAHHDITASDFLKVQDMLDNGEILPNPGREADVLLARKIGDTHYLIPLQVGKRGGNQLSFFRLDQGEKDREKLRKRGKVLRKEKN